MLTGSEGRRKRSSPSEGQKAPFRGGRRSPIANIETRFIADEGDQLGRNDGESQISRTDLKATM